MTDENTFPTGATTSTENEMKRAKRQAQRTTEDLQSAGAAVVEKYKDKAEQVWGDAKAQAQTWQEDGVEYVRDNPMKAAMTALAIGFVIGMMIRR